jgi:uncharacterized protein (TIGR02611 family)
MGHWLRNIGQKLRIKNPAIRRFVVGFVGIIVLIVGVALLVLPGPAFVVIPLGLAILATEFYWARHWLEKAKKVFERAKTREGRKEIKGRFQRAFSPK